MGESGRYSVATYEEIDDPKSREETTSGDSEEEGKLLDSAVLARCKDKQDIREVSHDATNRECNGVIEQQVMLPDRLIQNDSIHDHAFYCGQYREGECKDQPGVRHCGHRSAAGIDQELDQSWHPSLANSRKDGFEVILEDEGEGFGNGGHEKGDAGLSIPRLLRNCKPQVSPMCHT